MSLWTRQTKESIHVAPPGDGASEQAFDDLVADQVSKGRDVYFGVALRRPMLTRMQRGKVADCRGLPGLWLDIDLDRAPSVLPAPGQTQLKPHAAPNLPKTDAQACEILNALPPPTAIIDSGFGWHCYWLFDVVHPISYVEGPSISRASEIFQRKAAAHGKHLGYHVDVTADLARVLRVPGTINTKAGASEPVQVLFADGPRYASLNALLEASGIDHRAQISPSSFQPSALPEDVPDELLKPRDDAAQTQTPEWVADALTRLNNPESRALMQKVLSGESFADPGHRDQTLQRVASIIAYIAPDRDPRELTEELLAQSLSTFDDVDRGKYTQDDRIDWASEKISRAQEDRRRDRVADERRNARIADVLLRESRGGASRRDQRLGPAPAGPYTDEEVDAFAAQQGTNVSGFVKRWIIQKGASFYIYVNGDYQLPINANELDNSLPRDLGPAVAGGFIKLDTISAKGEPRKKTTKEILADYTSVARTVVAHLDLGHSYYDSESQTFHEATCPVRPLESAYCPEVDNWLKLLGGVNADKLLDWVATVTQLNKQSAALYLQGPPGTGKSLLSQGLAKIWHMGGPTELVRVLGEWSGDLARCPLVVADEQIPQSFRGQRTSAELRSLIGSSGRTLSRKYIANADLNGAVRLILSANNADMLVFDEHLSQGDLEAVAGRFLHIAGDDQAALYLKSISTDGWVDDCVIAKHALWLRDNRTVVPGRRFLVEGSANEVSKMLATRGGVAGRVAEWLVRFVCENAAIKSSIISQDLARIGNGKLLVNTNAVVSFWDVFVKSSKVPSTPQVGSALRNLSLNGGQQIRPHGGKRFFEIDLEAIAQWSESNLVGDIDTIVDRVSEDLP